MGNLPQLPITDSPVDVKAARNLEVDAYYSFQALTNRKIYYDETDVEPVDATNAIFLAPGRLYTVLVEEKKIWVWSGRGGGSLRITKAAI